jgi:hypothetical protein
MVVVGELNNPTPAKGGGKNQGYKTNTEFKVEELRGYQCHLHSQYPSSVPGSIGSETAIFDGDSTFKIAIF